MCYQPDKQSFKCQCPCVNTSFQNAVHVDTQAPAGRSAAEGAGLQAEYFENRKKRYQLQLPAGWQQKQKAGADALFEDPERKSSNIGVTVAPVRVKTLQEFGDIDVVADKLLAAEQNKVRRSLSQRGCTCSIISLIGTPMYARVRCAGLGTLLSEPS